MDPRRLFLAPLLLSVLVPAAWAQDCVPARLLATMRMQDAEPESNIRTVPVTLNGVTRQMVLDTGGAITQLSRNTIEELNLPEYGSSAAVYDINGRVSHRFAMVKELAFGDLRRNDAALMVWPEPVRPYAGELAQDLLQPYDVDVDFGTGLLKMYAKASKDGTQCPGPAGWVPLARSEMRNKGWHLHIPVTLDGHSYDAIFDTGSRHTIMRSPAARRDFGLSQDSPDMEPFRAINGDPFLNGHLHRFSKLSFAGMTMEKPEVLIVPDMLGRNADHSVIADNPTHRHNEGLILPELSLGMDVLKHLHLYMAFGEQALYVAPLETPPGATPRLSTVKP
ncbi:MAG TPA: retropepsin-like aspartic protease [Rhizomicrobium sp.]|nr:retropepsin-like aspartic protease [Rhizomicrobium sp.]